MTDIKKVSALTLVGGKRAGYDGEMISRLISVHDTGRSVSKAHLPVLAETGARVQFGDRSFVVAKA